MLSWHHIWYRSRSNCRCSGGATSHLLSQWDVCCVCVLESYLAPESMRLKLLTEHVPLASLKYVFRQKFLFSQGKNIFSVSFRNLNSSVDRREQEITATHFIFTFPNFSKINGSVFRGSLFWVRGFKSNFAGKNKLLMVFP